MAFCWGNENANFDRHQGLIIAAYYEDNMEIANIVYIDPSEVLVPVPRSLYRPRPEELIGMTNSFKRKKTTLLPDGTAVSVQINPITSAANCMCKGGKLLLGMEKVGSDWVMEVDVAVSDGPDKRAFAQGSSFSGCVKLDKNFNLDPYESEKPYKGMIKLVIFYDMMDDLATRGIRKFVEAQLQFKQAGQACFEFLLYKVYETDDPNPTVVYDAPWQPFKRMLTITPAQVGDVDDEEESDSVLPSVEAKKVKKGESEKQQAPIAYVWKEQVDEEVRAETERLHEQMAVHMLQLYPKPFKPLTLLPESIEQIYRAMREVTARAKETKRAL